MGRYVKNILIMTLITTVVMSLPYFLAFVILDKQFNNLKLLSITILSFTYTFFGFLIINESLEEFEREKYENK